MTLSALSLKGLVLGLAAASTAAEARPMWAKSWSGKQKRDSGSRVPKLDARGMPITTTTTETTATETAFNTVWVTVPAGGQFPVGVTMPGLSATSAQASTATSAPSIAVTSMATSAQTSVVSMPTSAQTSVVSSAPAQASESVSSTPTSETLSSSAPSFYTDLSSTIATSSDSAEGYYTSATTAYSFSPSSSDAASTVATSTRPDTALVTTETAASSSAGTPSTAVTTSSVSTGLSSSAVTSMTTSFATSAPSSFVSSIVTSAMTSTLSTTASTTSTATSTSSTVSAASVTTGGSGLSTANLNTRMLAAYYPDWTASELPPSSIDFDKYDCVDFAFALPNSAFGLTFTQDDSESSLTSVVAYAHAAGKKARLSVGGWTGSVYFSTAVSTAANRKTFVSNIAATYSAFDLDGIDIDWEYPGTQGDSDNIVSSSDSANFLLFLQLLRETLPSDAILSAAVQVWPFADANGNPMTDVSGFAEVLDWVLVMNYDIWGSSTTPGPNAPLSDGCNDSLQPLANAYAAVSSWTTAGMPASQIMLGVPAYGYIQMSTASALVDRRRSSKVTLYNADGGSSDGQIDFNSIVSQGGLTLASNGTYVASGGFVREWDSCSSTPWLKSASSGQVITYDDPESLSLKAQFARQAGLRGCNIWEMAGDTSNWALTDALRSGLGLS